MSSLNLLWDSKNYYKYADSFLLIRSNEYNLTYWNESWILGN